MEGFERHLAEIIINKYMAIKKVVPVKKVKAKIKTKVVKAPIKKVAAVKVPVNFPAKTFMVVSIVVFVATGLLLIWWSLLVFANSGTADSNAWIYSRHKYDEYRAANCGGDPLITMPNCPRGN